MILKTILNLLFLFSKFLFNSFKNIVYTYILIQFFFFFVYLIDKKLLLKVLYSLEVTDPVTPSIIDKIDSILILS